MPAITPRCTRAAVHEAWRMGPDAEQDRLVSVNRASNILFNENIVVARLSGQHLSRLELQ